jgi:zinc protease
VAGLNAITLDDVKDFAKKAYTRAALSVGVAGNAPPALAARLGDELAKLPPGPALPAPEGVAGRRPSGIEIDVVAKETRATGISFGFPIAVTRSHPDFAALSVARSWLGEHRASSSHLYQRIREVRGMNYGDYAYIEAFPRGMFQFFPDANLVRRDQLFEVWLRPLRSNEEGHMALRIALHELDVLAKRGFTREEFESTRNYLMKNVYLMTATQDQRLGYALDSRWYGTDGFVPHMRAALAKLTLGDANKALRRHLQTRDLQVVVITKDGEDMKRRLVGDLPSAMKYDGAKAAELLAEDKLIGAMKLGIAPAAVTITPLARVFAE